MKEITNIFLIGSLLGSALLYFSQNIVVDIPGFDFFRGTFLLVLGLIALVLSTRFILKKISRIWLKGIFLLSWAPLFLIVLVFLFLTSTCTFSGRHKHPQTETVLPGGRVYVDMYGDQGALGYAGEAVYVERNLVGPFYFRKILCYGTSKYSPPTFRIVSTSVVECTNAKNKKNVTYDLK